ncbi:hypothetical protein V6N13_134057 [Hibiscus sabdariffa]|uniref:Uncharacterized protein n=1 Tax=Hibiscus sabdariffa TaxID=183260 RepID=A0ABR2QZD2_9ROSI
MAFEEVNSNGVLFQDTDEKKVAHIPDLASNWIFGVRNQNDCWEEGSKAQAMVVQFVLEPLWQAYNAALESKVSKEILEEVIKDLQILL